MLLSGSQSGCVVSFKHWCTRGLLVFSVLLQGSGRAEMKSSSGKLEYRVLSLSRSSRKCILV